MADRIIREPERRSSTGLGRTTWWSLEKRGLAPKRVALVGGRCGWRESEIQEWIKNRRPVGEAA